MADQEIDLFACKLRRFVYYLTCLKTHYRRKLTSLMRDERKFGKLIFHYQTLIDGINYQIELLNQQLEVLKLLESKAAQTQFEKNRRALGF